MIQNPESNSPHVDSFIRIEWFCLREEGPIGRTPACPAGHFAQRRDLDLQLVRQE